MSGPALPPSDRVVFALWRRGDVQAASSFALAAMARGDRFRAQVREQLDRLRAGRDLDEPASVPALDEELLAALVDRYRYHEARIVLDAAELESTPGGRRLALVLNEVLAPFPDDAEASFAAVLHLVRAGQATSALRALDEVVRESTSPPAWLLARQRALAALVRGGWKQGPAPVEKVTRDMVIGLIRRRDMVGALEAAKKAEARELAAVIARLVTATQRVFTESSYDSDDPSTTPMEGHRLCEFQIQMGVLDQADRGYRVLLRKDPEDDRARTLLADVINLRQALGETPEPMPQRTASVSWLSKNAPRKSGSGGWASGAERKYPRFEDASGDATDVLEASQEAELLLKLGKAEQALDMYRILAIRHPLQQIYRKRISEIEALIAQRGVPTSAEVTLKHDLSELRQKAVPTNPAVKLPPRSHPRYSEDDEEFPTVIERAPNLFGDDTEKE